MSEMFLCRLLFAAILSGAFLWSLSIANQEECNPELMPSRDRYRPHFPAMVLPACLLTYCVLFLYFIGPVMTIRRMLSLCAPIFLHLSIYYAILLAALPVLRERIRPRACAALWLLPNYLYVIGMSSMNLERPLLFIPLPFMGTKTIFAAWFAGFLTIFLWKIYSHISFRRFILKDASAVTSEDILDIWKEELLAANTQKPLSPPVYSPHVKTPLSIGFLRKNMQIVLSHREYTKNELRLIFRHEIIHIQRTDSESKFFMVFCTAICWFNPLMWKAMRRSAEDLELSCDEAVLYDSTEETRQRYASLILKTAGDERGFTTCLSASASTLRYRLQNIMKPRQQRSGSLFVVLVFFLLIMTSGYISLGYEQTTGEEVIFREIGSETFSPEIIHYFNETAGIDYLCTDETALNQYLRELEVYRITGSYTFPSEGDTLKIWYRHNGKTVFHIVLNDDSLITSPINRPGYTNTYCITQDIDWDYIESLLEPS